MKRLRIAIVASLPALAGCGPASKAVVIRGVHYRFPPEHEPSVIAEAKDTDAFARIKPRGASFHLVFSDRHYLPNAQGENVPTIDWVNSANSAARVIEQDGETVVCRESHPLAHYTCGIRILDAGLRWAAVFDRSEVANAATIHSEAAAYLVAYRRAASKPDAH